MERCTVNTIAIFSLQQESVLARSTLDGAQRFAAKKSSDQWIGERNLMALEPILA